jgi:hypothetical protein
MPVPSSSSGGSQSLTKTITQTAHGFTVGKWVYVSAASTYALADADALSSNSSVTDANTFAVTTSGYISGLPVLAAGAKYYLSSTAGLITTTVEGKPVLITDTTTSGYVQINDMEPVSTVIFKSGAVAFTADYGKTYSHDTSASGQTVILPTAVGNNGREITIFKSTNDTRTVNITTTASQTINDGSTFILDTLSSVTFISDGANWIAKKPYNGAVARAVYVDMRGTNANSNYQTISTGSPGVNWSTVLGTGTRVTLNLAGSNTTGNINVAPNSITIPLQGRYRISFAVTTTTTQGGGSSYYAQIVKNGSVMAVNGDEVATQNVGELHWTVSYTDTLQAGDVIDIRVAGSGANSVGIRACQLEIKQEDGFLPVTGQIQEFVSPVYAAATVAPTAGQNSSAVANSVAFMSINIPSAGTWEIEYSVRGSGTGGATGSGGISAALYDNTPALLSNSEMICVFAATAATQNDQTTGTRTYIVTTTGAATYNVRVWNSAGSTVASAISDGNGRSYMSATKLGTTAITTTTRAIVDADLTTQVATTSADVTLTGLTEIIDNTNSFNPTTGIFIAPRAGFYRYEVITTYDGGSTDGKYLKLKVNGTTVRTATNSFAASGSNLPQIVLSNIVQLTANDSVIVTFGHQSNGVNTGTPVAIGGQGNHGSYNIEEITATY